MEELTGKTLVFTDQHFGVKGNSLLRQRIGALVIKKILDAVDRDSISNIIFCGDYFHQRNAVTVDTLNIAYKCLQALAKKCKVYMILGNHDLFNKNSTDVSSVNIFKDNPSIFIISAPEEVVLNGKLALLVPWLSDLSMFKASAYDFMFGHFDISSKFLISSYVQEHSRSAKASTSIANELSKSITPEGAQYALADTIGDFVELAKLNGTIFAGHIHQHKEMTSKGRKFIFIGSPYQQNLGDIGSKCGFYVIDEHGDYAFNEIDGIPKHVQFKSSDIIKTGINNFDFSAAQGNIVQKVYDVDISMEDELEVNKKIASFKPYEELLPDYQVALDFTKATETSQDSLVMKLKKSKLSYIESYIEQLDNKVLDDVKIDRAKLLAVMKCYYEKAVGEGDEV